MTSEDMPQGAAPSAPGDEVPPGTPGSGETICPVCGGKGSLDSGASCGNCAGTGKVQKAIGGG